jgi:hypothetical protein
VENTGSMTGDTDRAAGDTDPVTGDPLASDTRATPVANDFGGPRATMDPDAPTATDIPRDPDAVTATDTSADPDAVTATGTGTGTGPSATPEDPATPEALATPEASEVTPDSATPAAATAPGATPAAPVPGAPGTGSTTGVQAASAALVTHGAELRDDWARIQSAFVDDPRGSVSQAADLVSQVTSSLVNALQERERTLRGAWDKQSSQGSDTENLRNALRDYRAFFEMLTKV